MNEITNSITLVTISDNQYSVMLAALLKSIEVNAKPSITMKVYIVNDGISPNNVKKIRKSVSGLIVLEFIDIREIIKVQASLPLDSSSFPLNIYVRLFIPYFIPEHIERVVYLDVDMITKRDISELWKIDMKGNVIAAVADRCETVDSSWGGIRNYKALGLNPKARYFNSGLLVIDVIAWRNSNYTNDILLCISNNKEYASFPDQYGLNVIFSEKWLELDQRWNCFAQSEIADPYIIHFIGIKPIFSTYNYNQAYSKEFFKNLELTEWKNYKLLKEHNRLLKKLTSVLIKKVMYILNWRRK